MITEYWCINLINDDCYKVDLKNYVIIVGAIKRGETHVEFKDISDSVCGIMTSQLSSWHESTPAKRALHRDLQKFGQKKKINRTGCNG